MHMLHLLRHAKSSWKGDKEDHKRPLSKRGREAARLVGRHLAEALGSVDLVLCSSAARTRETLEIVLAQFPNRPDCLIEHGLYLADSDRLIERLRLLDEDRGNVLMIGHNPGLHQLAILLAEPHSPLFCGLGDGKFPTLARASLQIGARWAELAAARNPLIAYVTPASRLGEHP
jgi:phosphohistidine phosphatase